MVELARRSFITGLVALGVAAPAIVRAGSLMPVKQMVWNAKDIAALLDRRLDHYDGYQDDRVFMRYSGYEGVEFDAAEFRWKNPEEIAKEIKYEVRSQLFELKNKWLRNYDPKEYEFMKARFAANG